MSKHPRLLPLRSLVALSACGLLLQAIACDRNIEPFDPDETPRKPDLSRIFPDPAAPPTAQGSGAGTASGGAPMGVVPPSRTESSRAGASAGEPVRGSIEVAPELAGQIPAGAVLFVIARNHGAAGGPPLAVLRVPAPSLPMAFEIGPENVMIPSMLFEGDISLTAQLDADGNATTRQPGDLRGELAAPIRPGAEGVKLVLDQRL